MDRRINAAGLALVKEFESLRLKAYPDPGTGGAPWTIGFGHTGPDVKPGQVITVAKAEQFLRDDLAEAEDAVSKFVTVTLNDNQFAALVSFTFNVGREAFRRSTLRKKLNAGDYDAVPGQLMRWVNAGGKKLNGLVRRRKAEGDLWNTPFVADIGIPISPPAPPEPPVSAQKPSPSVPIPGKAETPSPSKAGGIAAAFVLLVVAVWAAVSGLFCAIPFISNICGG